MCESEGQGKRGERKHETMEEWEKRKGLNWGKAVMGKMDGERGGKGRKEREQRERERQRERGWREREREQLC